MALRKKKTCNGCKALCEVSHFFCELGYKLERRSVDVKMLSGRLWSMYEYRPLEICTKPLTIKKLMTLKGY